MVWPFHGSSSQTPRSGSVAARSPSVRDAAPRAAPSKLFGVVTLWDGSDSHECALPLWCQQARRLAAKIPPPWRTELVVMAPKTSGECDAHYVWSDVTARANQAYLERVRIEGSWKYLKHCTLLKWAVFSLSHLELLLYADVDVDLDPARPGPARAVEESLFRFYFNAATAAFLQSSAVIVGAPDHASPINTGDCALTHHQRHPRHYPSQTCNHRLSMTDKTVANLSLLPRCHRRLPCEADSLGARGGPRLHARVQLQREHGLRQGR